MSMIIKLLFSPQDPEFNELMKARQREWTNRSRSRKKAIQQLAKIEEISSVANIDPTPTTKSSDNSDSLSQ